MAITNLQELTGVSNILLVTAQSSQSNLLGYQAQSGPVLSSNAPTYVPTFIFHYEGEQIVTIEADITDHFVETNSAVQDQVAQKPVEISTHGFIGDLNNVVPPSLQAKQAVVMSVLGNVSAYNPSLAISALNAYNQAYQAYQIANDLAQSVPSVNSLLGSKYSSWAAQTSQASAYSYFWQQFQQRIFFTIQTPWALFRNMQIKTMRAVQGEDTRTVTDFQLTFKQIQFAQAIYTGTTSAGQYSASDMAPRAAGQATAPVNLGTNVPGPTTVTSASLY